MFWYKMSLTLTTERASKRKDTEIVFSVSSLTLTLDQSTRFNPFQARSQVILRGGAIQKGDGPNEVGGASL